jgi:hypothetical protein
MHYWRECRRYREKGKNRKQLLDDLNEKRSYWNLDREAKI